MNVLFVSSEVSPFAKTGGLADVAGALPPVLKRAGVDIRIAMPDYPSVAETGVATRHSEAHALIPIGDDLLETHLHLADHQGVPLLLVRNREYFMRPGLYGDARGAYPDNGERFGLFCRAVLRMLPQIDFRPDIIHLNDWQTALIAVLLRSELANLPFFAATRTLLTIHNLGYQGRFEPALLDRLGLDPALHHVEALEFHGDVSLLKGGVVCADRLNTVSPTYAREIRTAEFGHGLDGLLTRYSGKLSGILNGLDTQAWNPGHDPLLEAPFSADALSGKATCKAALQRELGLRPDPARPLLALVTRLDPQKGIDLVEEAWPALLAAGTQLVLVGSGDPRHAAAVTELARQSPGSVSATIEFDEELAHRVYAGSDLFLMPSRYEPCGLSQLIALRYGCVPVVRRTGGLADTIRDADADPRQGNGFSFETASGAALAAAVRRALAAYAQPQRWQQIMRRGMSEDHAWTASAARYLELYRETAGAQP